jgi:hypothetical protein
LSDADRKAIDEAPTAAKWTFSDVALRKMIPLDPSVKALVGNDGYYDLRNGALTASKP